MFPIPAAAEPLVQAIRGAFTQPTFERFIALMSGLIVTMGRRTVSHALRIIEPQLDGHWCNYHRLYSWARFSMWKLGKVLTQLVVGMLPANYPIVLVVDETVDQKQGDRVWARGTHYDAKRSSRRHKHIKFGHQWLVMCVLVWLPGIDRPWALPILSALCRDKTTGKKIGQREKPGSVISKQLLIRLMRWFPDRKFILLGDSKALSHAVACFARRHADRVTVISRLRCNANLYGEPKPRKRPGAAPLNKGKKLPAPSEQILSLKRQQATVASYGSMQRRISYVTDAALWYGKHDNQTIPIRWVGVCGDKKQNLEETYLYCTDPTLPAIRIIELYALRWNIEVTFEEARALLGLETTRHWCRQSVLRVTPILLGLFTAITWIWRQLPEKKRCSWSETPCYHKQHLTFADAIYAVRRELWQTTLMGNQRQRQCLTSLDPSLREAILWHLSAAA
jgi:DDE superfamily endonuclease